MGRFNSAAMLSHFDFVRLASMISPKTSAKLRALVGDDAANAAGTDDEDSVGHGEKVMSEE